MTTAEKTLSIESIVDNIPEKVAEDLICDIVETHKNSFGFGWSSNEEKTKAYAKRCLSEMTSYKDCLLREVEMYKQRNLELYSKEEKLTQRLQNLIFEISSLSLKLNGKRCQDAEDTLKLIYEKVNNLLSHKENVKKNTSEMAKLMNMPVGTSQLALIETLKEENESITKMAGIIREIVNSTGGTKGEQTLSMVDWLELLKKRVEELKQNKAPEQSDEITISELSELAKFDEIGGDRCCYYLNSEEIVFSYDGNGTKIEETSKGYDRKSIIEAYDAFYTKVYNLRQKESEEIEEIKKLRVGDFLVERSYPNKPSKILGFHKDDENKVILHYQYGTTHCQDIKRLRKPTKEEVKEIVRNYTPLGAPKVGDIVKIKGYATMYLFRELITDRDLVDCDTARLILIGYNGKIGKKVKVEDLQKASIHEFLSWINNPYFSKAHNEIAG